MSMPSKKLQCDFCDTVSTKQQLAGHIKSKHTAELAQHLIKDAQTSSINVIWSYIKKTSPKNMPIPSRIHPNIDYWFGVNPIVVEEKDNVAPYIDIPANLEAHGEYIKELMKHISLPDFIELHRQFQLNSKEMAEMKEQVKQQTHIIAEITEQSSYRISELESQLQSYKATIDEVTGGVTIDQMKQQLMRAERSTSIVEKRFIRAQEEIERLQWKCNQLEKRNEELYQEAYSEEKSRRVIEIEEGYMKMIERLKEQLHKEREKTLSDKKDNKEKEKKKAEKERLLKQQAELKRQMKALQKSLSSDSDSD